MKNEMNESVARKYYLAYNSRISETLFAEFVIRKSAQEEGGAENEI